MEQANSVLITLTQDWTGKKNAGTRPASGLDEGEA